jgi:hypothetical protein
LINQPEEPEEDDNADEEADLSINAVFNAAKMLANYMTLNKSKDKF